MKNTSKFQHMPFTGFMVGFMGYAYFCLMMSFVKDPEDLDKVWHFNMSCTKSAVNVLLTLAVRNFVDHVVALTKYGEEKISGEEREHLVFSLRVTSHWLGICADKASALCIQTCIEWVNEAPVKDRARLLFQPEIVELLAGLNNELRNRDLLDPLIEA